MGGTVPKYGLASDREKRKWKLFREQLDKSERKIFDEMMSISRLYDVTGVDAYLHIFCAWACTKRTN